MGQHSGDMFPVSFTFCFVVVLVVPGSSGTVSLVAVAVCIVGQLGDLSMQGFPWSRPENVVALAGEGVR